MVAGREHGFAGDYNPRAMCSWTVFSPSTYVFIRAHMEVNVNVDNPIKGFIARVYGGILSAFMILIMIVVIFVLFITIMIAGSSSSKTATKTQT